MRIKRGLWLASLLVIPGLMLGCSNEEGTVQSDSGTATSESATDAGQGTLAVVANGEDFVRQGFVSKDGWQIDFEHVYVTLDEVQAYQTELAFDPEAESELKPEETVVLVSDAQTVDLAEGAEEAEPIMVMQLDVPPGTYNALSWQVVEAEEGPAEGQTIVLDGTATKDGQTVDFLIGLNQPLAYTCGEFVGDERKGIVKSGSDADLEVTLHFDHLFGDGDAPADDPINTGAVGFDPFAALAENGQLSVVQATLEEELKSEDYQTMQEAVMGLGHVGEGHCRLEETTAQSNS